jgi:5'-nucleotidase
VDLILAGHPGQVVDGRIAGMPVVGPDGGSIAVVDLVRTDAGGRQLRARLERLDTTASGGPAGGLAPLARRADSLRAHAVATLRRPVARADKLPMLVAEARRNAGRADLGLVRSAALAADLPAGSVTYGRLMAVEPSGADLVVVRVTGEALLNLFEQSLAEGAPGIELAGAIVRYEPRARPGRRIKSVTLAGGRKFRAADSYTLVTDDATAGGAGGLPFLQSLRAERLGLVDVEAVARYLRRRPQPVEIEGAPAFISTRP